MAIFRIFDAVMQRTLRSVIFGIGLMVTIAVYIAIGSSMPAVREYFERDELAFFNWWPLSTLMFLLVANLITVTLDRIPFTPPRWGVWCVHAGIVTLVAGGYWHYSQKLEGSVLIGVGQATAHYYDRWERALYTKVGGTNASTLPLAGLPRFGTYPADDAARAEPLRGAGLEKLSPVFRRLDDQGQPTVAETLGTRVGVPDLRLDVVGYYPYADIVNSVVEDAASPLRGVKVVIDDHHDHGAVTNWVVSGDPKNRFFTNENFVFQHLELDSPSKVNEVLAMLRDAHALTVTVGGFEQTIRAGVGGTYVLGKTGYVLRIESFQPAWRTRDGQTVQLLTMTVKTPTRRFTRQVINGRDTVTDFNPDEPGGPLGKRQTKPLDDALKTSYVFQGDAKMLPGPGMLLNTILTVPGSPALTVASYGINDALTVHTFPDGVGRAEITAPRPADESAFLLGAGDDQRPTSAVDFQRVDHVASRSWVVETPKEKRDKETGAGGTKQVAVVRASGGGQSELIYVPYSQSPYELPWSGGLVRLAGMNAVVQLQLGNTARMLPASIKLDKFQADSYAGLKPGANVAMRDFKSFVTLTDRATGVTSTGEIKMNEPVFYKGGDWLFFQSGWDYENQKFSIIGIGNRPGVAAMVTGCVMIFTGLLYAFYVKPVLIRVRKEKALRAAAASGKTKARQREAVVT